MMTRDEAYKASPPIEFDSLEGWLRRYALAHANLLMAQERGDDKAVPGWERRCQAWIMRLSQHMRPAQCAFELDEARRYGEHEALLGLALMRRVEARRAEEKPPAGPAAFPTHQR